MLQKKSIGHRYLEPEVSEGSNFSTDTRGSKEETEGGGENLPFTSARAEGLKVEGGPKINVCRRNEDADGGATGGSQRSLPRHISLVEHSKTHSKGMHTFRGCGTEQRILKGLGCFKTRVAGDLVTPKDGCIDIDQSTDSARGRASPARSPQPRAPCRGKCPSRKKDPRSS
ncbi:hypothetical protein CEXT_469361 [Caerostris extrusa]|uniref:Uncharacterized protein n=1 Tax=Caerostris extrusa TaxID=172846 RepID=A0AAV4WTK1_CAEEX|nr:hypothetical protein CEXT_469361 [Caerostris extrusa]